MKKSAIVIACAALGLAAAAPALAQDPDWMSDANRTFWNGVTEAELKELVAEAEGVWTDRPDSDGLRISEVNWPDLAHVTIQESDCAGRDLEMPARNCGSMELIVTFSADTGRTDEESIEWGQGQNRWLSYSETYGISRLYRREHHLFGTTRGHVLSDLMLFRAFAPREVARIQALAPPAKP